MAKHCETFDHTADVGLSARADTLGELMEALAEGLCDVVCDRSRVEPVERRRLRVAAEDTEALAVDFLAKVLLTLQADRFLIAQVRVEQAGETALAAELAGQTYDPNRHEIRTEVKAVTYHQLSIVRDGAGWAGRVILDL
jgi:SHS2 domain-containing protein